MNWRLKLFKLRADNASTADQHERKIVNTRSNEPLIPFLQPVWSFRGMINEVLVDAMGDEAHRRSARLLLYSSALITAMARSLAAGPLRGGIELVLSFVLAHAVLRVADPIIKFRHDMKFPDIAVTPYIGVLGLLVKAIVGVRLWITISTLVLGGNIATAFGTLAGLVLFQTAMVVVLDDGDRPARQRAFVGLN